MNFFHIEKWGREVATLMLIRYERGEKMKFLTTDSIDEIYGILKKLVEEPWKCEVMKKVTKEKGMRAFLYMDILRRSIAE